MMLQQVCQDSPGQQDRNNTKHTGWFKPIRSVYGKKHSRPIDLFSTTPMSEKMPVPCSVWVMKSEWSNYPLLNSSMFPSCSYPPVTLMGSDGSFGCVKYCKSGIIWHHSSQVTSNLLSLRFNQIVRLNTVQLTVMQVLLKLASWICS